MLIVWETHVDNNNNKKKLFVLLCKSKTEIKGDRNIYINVFLLKAWSTTGLLCIISSYSVHF